MRSSEPASCVFGATGRDQPIHLWDAFDGHLRASYCAHNEVDDVVGASSVSFAHRGELLIGGYRGTLRVFDVSRPGPDCSVISTRRRKGKCLFGESQPGILSSISVTDDPHACGGSGGLVAVGSYDRSIHMYSLADLQWQAQLPLYHLGGVTQLEHLGSTYLLSAARKDPHILCWDLRYLTRPVASFTRIANSNQHVSFDVVGQHTLISASLDGHVGVHNA